MANDFYQATGSPSTRSSGSSSTMRAEFAAIEDAFDKLPTMTGNADEVVVVDAGGNALTTKAFSAENMANTPAGGISATDMQGAINELDTEKAPKHQANLTGGVTIRREDSIAEGGQLSLTRAVDDAPSWSIDVYGSGLDAGLRFLSGGAAKASLSTSGLLSLPNQPLCQASRNLATFESFAANTSYGILGALHTNRGGFYLGSVVGANGAALHVPASGYYLLSLSAYFQGGSSGGRLRVLRNNGTELCLVAHASMTGDEVLSSQAIVYLDAGDYINYKTGTASGVTVYSANLHTFVTLAFVG